MQVLLCILVEGEQSGFVSIPVSVYWCIVTLTTVGFGDIAPVTPLGQFIAAIIMIMGYGIIAVPTGIVSAEYASKKNSTLDDPEYIHVNTQSCQNCNENNHHDHAEFCHKCGTTLAPGRCYSLMSKKPLLICVVGATAIGKTTLSIALAKAFDTEIISADSRQFYTSMNIGTAVPSTQELAAAPHHFIQHKSIFDTYSVGDFEREALLKLDTLFSEKSTAILVGGSGLYVDAVVNGLDHFP